jgi:hypothetical protein
VLSWVSEAKASLAIGSRSSLKGARADHFREAWIAMTPRDKGKLLVAGIVVAVGILAAFLPKQWIEELMGIAPDGGSGFFELLFVVVPIAIGFGAAAHTLLGRRLLSSRPGQADSGPNDRR